MRERPILFSAPMVRALLDGRKTQTRRIVRAQVDVEPTGPPYFDEGCGGWKLPFNDCVDPGCSIPGPDLCPPQYAEVAHWIGPCPYGAPGDRLWVRETWYCDHAYVGDFERTRRTYLNRQLTDAECIAEWKGEDDSMMYYRADGELTQQIEQCEDPNCWRPSIHMPRWASRITLEVTRVRVERLQDISEEDARAEGVDPILAKVPSHRDAFMYLWDDINGKRAPWKSNPWCWVVEFKREQP